MMNIKRLSIPLLLMMLILLGACRQEIPAPVAPSLVPFPTPTTGFVLNGILPTPNAFGPDVIAPATVVALANRGTATPDRGACPPATTSAQLEDLPRGRDAIANEIARFLSAGGNLTRLTEALRDRWRILPVNGFVREDVDVTAEGTTDILFSLSLEEGGFFLILSCQDRAYRVIHQVIFPQLDAPQVLFAEDMNVTLSPEIVVTGRSCLNNDQNLCQYQTYILTWDANLGRMVNLLNTPLLTDELPQIVDSDNDLVDEILVQLNNIGDINTGPLRTGRQIYDWNGSTYVLSIVELDAPEYQIQVIQEADRNFLADRMGQAIELYQLAYTDEELRIWLRNEAPILESYILYRLMLAWASQSSAEAAIVFERLRTDFGAPGEGQTEAPPFATLGQIFWDAYSENSSLSAGCEAVQLALAEVPLALTWMNRYGARNLGYTADDMCPF
jgi:hypothetical protein